jgi:hypothetical protein
VRGAGATRRGAPPHNNKKAPVAPSRVYPRPPRARRPVLPRRNAGSSRLFSPSLAGVQTGTLEGG